MQITFYTNFYKKENSTKVPTVGGTGNPTSSYTVTGVLKEPSSILNPVISFQGQVTQASSSIPGVTTYAYIPAFGRYYFVKDWEWTDGLWTVQLEVDVLATYKNHIGEETEYVLRTDSTTIFNTYITDTTYPATNDFSIVEYELPNAFQEQLYQGCYIVGIISGGTSDAVGAISYYAMTATEFKSLKDVLFSDTNLIRMGIIDSGGTALVTDMSKETLKVLYNPYQYIASCMWLPFPVSTISGGQPYSTIDIGWWDYPTLSGTLITPQIVNFQESSAIPLHPQSSARGKYLNYSPYTRRTLIGRFGTVAFDTSYIEYGGTLSIQYKVDIISGQCKALIQTLDTGTPAVTRNVAEKDFLLGVPIQIAQIGVDYLGQSVSFVNSVNNAVSSISVNPVKTATGMASAITNGIYDAIQSTMPQLETSGSNGSFTSTLFRTKFINQFFTIVDEDIHHKGRPLCELRRLDTLSGFILCAEGDLDLNCFSSEREQIKSYLTTGFFWE